MLINIADQNFVFRSAGSKCNAARDATGLSIAEQCLAKREDRFYFSVRLGIGLKLGYDSVYWLGLGSGFGSEIRAQGQQK